MEFHINAVYYCLLKWYWSNRYQILSEQLLNVLKKKECLNLENVYFKEMIQGLERLVSRLER